MSVLASLQQEAPADVQPSLSTLQGLWQRKLYHQLTDQLQLIVKMPAAAPVLLQLYTHFVVDFAPKMNQLRLAEIACAVASTVPDRKEAEQFLSGVTQSLSSSTDPEAFVLCQITAAHYKLLLGDLDAISADMALCESLLDAQDGVDNEVMAAYYRISGDYYKAKAEYSPYYKNSLLYLACVKLDSDLSSEEKLVRSHDLAISALLSTTIYNFGELLLHPILLSLSNTEHEWLRNLLFAFNSGDISKFEQLVSQFNQEPILMEQYAFLRQKICLMALIEAVFKRPVSERTLTFSTIAQETRLPSDEVEHLVMKALSLKLIKGSIDQVQSTANISWVQPRVLDKSQVIALSKRLSDWTEHVNETALNVRSQAPEIFSH